MIAEAPPGPIKTKWGLGLRDYDECDPTVPTNARCRKNVVVRSFVFF